MQTGLLNKNRVPIKNDAGITEKLKDTIRMGSINIFLVDNM
jgi:hypothetical protein